MNVIIRMFSLITLLSSFFVTVAGASESEPLYSPEIIVVADDDELAALEEAGVIIWHHREDMVLALVPVPEDAPRKSAPHKGGKNARRAVPVMDVAKTHFDAVSMHSGAGLPRAYDGTGVVVGFCDIAFDPNHINFKDADGNSRVRKLVYLDEPHGVRNIMTDPDEIVAWTTDRTDAYHGTHVAGIMAGSYNGNGYGGMAPGAEIVGVTSQLYDAGILAACEEIIEYAQSVGKPAVINLSLGSYNGPHDGTTLFNRYLGLLGREAIICIAAGNAGDDHSSYRCTFSEQNPAWRVALDGNDWVHFNIEGMTDAWSHDERPVNARFLVYDTDTRTCVYEGPFVEFNEPGEIYLSSQIDPEVANLMEGDIYFTGRVDERNGRWVTEVEYSTKSVATAAPSDGKWARYRPALEFSASPGVHADITADASYSFMRQIPGYAAPGADLSISDIATGENVIVVGMYNNRKSMPTLSGTDRVFDHEPMTVNIGSGYGTLIDGRVLPHSLAPGGGVVSSCNRFYTKAHPDRIPLMNAVLEADGETYYWATDAGTSMATPYLAGCVATWLEANPALTVADVLDVLGKTNWHDYPDPMNPRHGLGWLRPYDGLKEVLTATGITEGAVETADVKIVIDGDWVEILNPGSQQLVITVTKADGLSPFAPTVTTDAITRLSLAPLSSGLYLITATPATGRPATTKLLH